MFELLQFEFMRNALLAGLLTGLVCGIIGSLVVVNRIVFLAGGVAHAAYGGIGMAFFFRWPFLPTTLCFSFFSAMVMTAVTLKDRHRSDTVIGVIWAVGMGIGIILLDLTPGYNMDLMSYLFGSILTVPKSDIWMMLAMDVGMLAVVFCLYNDFLAMSYDPEFARLRRVPVKPLYFLLLGMIALCVVMVIQVVGLILVIAMLTIPPYIAEKFSSSLAGMMVLSSLLGCLFSVVGLFLSYHFNLTAGATIILVSGTAFFIAPGISKLPFFRKKLSRTPQS